MRKGIKFGLVVILGLFVLSGCGNKENKADKKENSDATASSEKKVAKVILEIEDHYQTNEKGEFIIKGKATEGASIAFDIAYGEGTKADKNGDFELLCTVPSTEQTEYKISAFRDGVITEKVISVALNSDYITSKNKEEEEKNAEIEKQKQVAKEKEEKKNQEEREKRDKELANKSNPKESQAPSSNSSESSVSESEARMIQATAQIAIKRNGYEDDTSSQLKDWTINKMKYEDTYRWTAVTQSSNNGRVKVIFDWTGKDENDLIIKYLLIGGNEILNNLRQ
ncbi:hypothetical protein [Isobaculum melis]|uniref:Lipoprotein n=1 Tax=Isobaculum melis TaxID=142588 RepID=A0A1H9SVF3_9LACT|nr:hypothetical protein [Isobaculum melis]SER88349.1 hypothetical protein SAMN04488559_10938 [Isobaculum melis]